MISRDSGTFELDPYGGIRAGLSPEYARLGAEELTAALGPVPATLALHRLLNSSDLHAVLAILHGGRGPRAVRINGVDVSIPVYLRTLARLCREVAEHTDGEVPQFEQLIGPKGAAPQIGGSVGRKGANSSEDIKLLQRLLNLNLPLPDPPVPENGVLDGATIAAIENFQRVMLGVSAPDGKVEPRKITFQTLAVDKLAFLPHRCQLLSGTSVPLDATQVNPGFLTPTDVKRNSGLQDIVNRRVLGTEALKRLRFSLVDLTGPVKLADPQYAGHQDTVQGGLGSMAKVATLYAAYQLKFDLEELSRQRGITDRDSLFDAARELWNKAQKPNPASVTPISSAGPKIELQGSLVVVDAKPVQGVPGLSLPALEKIFTSVPGPPPGLTLRFIGSDRILVDPDVSSSPHDTAEVRNYIRGGGEALAQVRRLSFAERLFLMIDDSDNAAAHSCIEDVGFLFTASAIWQSDFYRPQRGGGLWEASTHDTAHRKRWIKPPVPKDQPGTDFVSATACSIAALFTLIEQGRLVNGRACTAMRHLLNKRKSGVTGGSNSRSYFKEGLTAFALDRIHSKLGIGNFLNDVAIIERTVHPDPADPTKEQKIRYVAAGFDDPSPARSSAPARFLNKLIVELDKCILENNGLLPPSAP
jgi:hypothetical protein